MPADMGADEHQIPDLADVVDLDIEVWKHIEELVPIPPDAVVAAVRRALGAQRRELYIRVVERSKGVEIALAQSVIGATDDLDVLLRHRPRSISRKGAAFRPKQ